MNLNFLVRALETAGESALKSFKVRNNKLSVGIKTTYLKEKTPHELVIREDILCQKIIIEAILSEQPDAVIYSEESENLPKLKMDTSSLKYVIDPLDGTHNFYFGLPYWGLSVGLLDQDNRSVGGVIYIPTMGIILKNEGANLPTMIRLNGGWQKVSTVPRRLSQSMVCYDNQFYKMGEKAISIYEKLTHETFTTRITGSAVADAALIATGGISARIWNNTLSYDVAAGMAVVQGAGGKVTGFAGEKIDVMAPKVVMSSDEALHNSLLELISSR